MLKKRYIYFLLASIILFTYACKNKAGQKSAQEVGYSIIDLPKPGTVDQQELERMRTSIGGFVTNFLVPSNYAGGILVAWKGNIVYENYVGNKVLNGVSSPIKDTDAIHVASTSKTFTAYITLLLYQQGKLQLTDTIQKFFPQFPYPGINVFMLLTHRSGLPKYDYFMEEKGAKLGRMATNEDVLQYLYTKKPDLYRPPNTGFQYCNTNYLILASIAEKIMGKPFPTIMHEKVFGPLQMKHSYVATNKDTLRNIMSLYNNGNVFNYTELDGTYGDKNVYTCAKDMLRWHTYLQHANIIRKSLMDSAYIGYSNEKPGIRNYGFGWRMFNLANNKNIIFHNGYWHGNNSCFARLIEEDVVIISTGNRLCKRGYGVMSFTGFFGDYLGFEDELEKDQVVDSSKVDPQEVLLKQFVKEQITVKKALQVDTVKLRLDSLRKDSLLKLKKIDSLKNINE
jgi:CubicO group peptidase (beta-lactamase class C family)